MEEIATIGLDIAKSMFKMHGISGRQWKILRPGRRPLFNDHDRSRGGYGCRAPAAHTAAAR